jgi:hypothetical protein
MVATCKTITVKPKMVIIPTKYSRTEGRPLVLLMTRYLLTNNADTRTTTRMWRKMFNVALITCPSYLEYTWLIGSKLLMYWFMKIFRQLMPFDYKVKKVNQVAVESKHAT